MSQPFRPMRRKVLFGLGAGVVALALPVLSPTLAAAHGGTLAHGHADTAAFMVVSRRLTERATLDAHVALRLETALAAQDPSFAGALQALVVAFNAHPRSPTSEVLASKATPTSAVVAASAILAGWYLGVAGIKPDSPVVAYQEALMFDPVRDVVAAPSYCREAPGYWTTRPPKA
jgi:hypothetical protein